jgi:hypothetical protein
MGESRGRSGYTDERVVAVVRDPQDNVVVTGLHWHWPGGRLAYP